MAIADDAAQIVALTDLKVSVGGAVVSPDRIKYAGLTPGSAGLYQINMALPDSSGPDPEVRVAVGEKSTPPGLKLNYSAAR